MPIRPKFLAGLLLLAAAPTQAAVKDQPVPYQAAVLEDQGLVHELQRPTYAFRVELVDDGQGPIPESSRGGKPFVAAVAGERYSVRLTNPLPVRVAVNLTVDGLNSISGKPCGPADGKKWLIEPYGSILIPGWQVSGGEARRFFFTPKHRSYAQWRGDRTGRDLAANCGVIGAAYFWSQADLDRYGEEHPLDRTTRRPLSCASSHACGLGAPACAPRAPEQAMDKKDADEPAGTGMGERESHPTEEVAFDYDRGMYSPAQAVVIYYDFAKPQFPQAFLDGGFAPQP
ncbi:MAG TPA: hypothetical protein VFR02_04170, partial [bacterium]|nr:hypothetical protein [bacterium]